MYCRRRKRRKSCRGKFLLPSGEPGSKPDLPCKAKTENKIIKKTNRRNSKKPPEKSPRRALHQRFPVLYFNAMDNILIGAFEKGEEFLVSELIKTCFDEFVAPGYTSAGNNFFYTYSGPEKIVERFVQGNVLLTAKANGEIVGVIEVRDGNHISLLFVNKFRHGNGIAKRLVAQAAALCREKDKGLRYFEVNASPYSEKIYARMGFKKTSNIQNVNGLKFIPMVLKLV